MKCSFCNRDAVAYIRYNGTHLCQDHFNRFFEKRVRLEFREEIKIDRPVTLGVAISGGKDSSVALYETHKIFGKRRDVRIIAITIDEGINSYRPKTMVSAISLANKLGVEHHIVKLEERYGITMDSISKEGTLSPCSYCGVFRRRLLNDISLDMKVDYLITGLNLDDTAQSIIMNFARGDIERLGRMGPHFRVKEGLIPRLQPLRRIPEKEILLFAILNGIDFSHDVCPYADSAIRNEFRESIDKWEERTPGTKFAILNSYDKIREILDANITGDINVNRCRICGAPSAGEICKSCAMEMELKR
ncbi:MAG: TIGR00269 family protein [Thermoplasmata archaeon]